MGLKSRELKRILIRDLEKRLAPTFIMEGFSCVPLSPADARSELKIAFPLGRLKRNRDGNLDLIDIQFDKYGSPRFVVNIGIAPEAGVVSTWGQHFHRDEIDAGNCPEAYRLYSSTFISRWFRLGFFTPKTEAAAKKLVDQVIGLSSEAMMWFDSKKVGKHMRRCGINA